MALREEVKRRVLEAYGRLHTALDPRPTRMAHRLIARMGFKPPSEKRPWAWQDEGFWWQADHIVPVAEGGGACGLENLQTLCTPCHKAKTAAQAREAAERRQARKRILERARKAGVLEEDKPKKRRRRKQGRRKGAKNSR